MAACNADDRAFGTRDGRHSWAPLRRPDLRPCQRPDRMRTPGCGSRPRTDRSVRGAYHNCSSPALDNPCRIKTARQSFGLHLHQYSLDVAAHPIVNNTLTISHQDKGAGRTAERSPRVDFQHTPCCTILVVTPRTKRSIDFLSVLQPIGVVLMNEPVAERQFPLKLRQPVPLMSDSHRAARTPRFAGR